MRVVLADLKGTEGLVTKDTVAGGYGSRFVPFSLTTHWFCHVKRSYVQIPSVQMAYLAAICARNGHEVVWTRSEVADGDVALVLSSLVDYRRETAWAEAARARGMRVGFVGLACSKLPELFLEHADFVVAGEPEEAIRELAEGRKLSGLVLASQWRTWTPSPFPGGTSSVIGRTVSSKSVSDPCTRGEGFPCWPAGAAPSSVHIA